MADELNIGQASALQTRATPYSGTPITTGLRLKEANILKDAELQARREAAEEKRRRALSKFESIRPINGMHPAFTKVALQAAQEGNYVLNSPDYTPEEKAMAKSAAVGIGLEAANKGKALNDFGVYVKNRKSLTYPGIGDAINIKSPEDLKLNLDRFDKLDRMIMDGAFGFEEDGMPYIQTPLTRQNIPETANKYLSRATGISEYDIINQTDKFAKIKQSLGKDEINNIVDNVVADDPDLAYQLRFDNKDLTKKYIQEEQSKNPTLDEQHIMMLVDQRLGREVLSKYYSDRYGIRTIPQKDTVNGYNVAGKVFNPGLADPLKNADAYAAAGILNAEQAAAIKQNPEIAAQVLANVPDLLSITPPNTGVYTIKDEKGNTFKADNLQAIYVPKTQSGAGGKWFMSGSRKTKYGEMSVLIPINEQTYGNLISVYGKLTTSDVEKLLNKRMADGGITNDKFVLNPLKPESKSTTTRQQNNVAPKKKKYNPKTGKFE